MDTIKQRIITSVFAKRSAAGAPQETYVSHVKILEENEEGGRKPRYILLSRMLSVRTRHLFALNVRQRTWLEKVSYISPR